MTNDALCAIDVTGGYRFKQRADLFLGDRLRFFCAVAYFHHVAARVKRVFSQRGKHNVIVESANEQKSASCPISPRLYFVVSRLG